MFSDQEPPLQGQTDRALPGAAESSSAKYDDLAIDLNSMPPMR
jgi:hypothetical protein